MQVKRILIVGSGSIGQRHRRIAEQLLPDADIRFLRHRLPEQGSCSNDFSTVAQAQAFAPDIAVVAGPATVHAELAMALAQAGAHLLIEKPLDASSQSAAPLVEFCRNSQRVLLVGYNLRFLPALTAFRAAVHEGRVGRILSVRAEVGQYLPAWRAGRDYRSTVSAQRALGGGVLLELSHEIDYLRWVFGEVEWIKAYAAHLSPLEVDVEDVAHLVLGFEAAGGPGTVAALSLDFFRRDTTRQCIAIGETGSLRWNAIEGNVDWWGQEASDWQRIYSLPHHSDDSYRAEWMHLLQCLRGEASPLVTGEDGLRTLQVVEAARRAATDGQAVVMKRKGER